MLQGQALKPHTRHRIWESSHETESPSSTWPELSKPWREMLCTRHQACGSRLQGKGSGPLSTGPGGHWGCSSDLWSKAPGLDPPRVGIPQKSHPGAATPEPPYAATTARKAAHQAYSLSQAVATAPATNTKAWGLSSDTSVTGQMNNSCYLRPPACIQFLSRILPVCPRDSLRNQKQEP